MSEQRSASDPFSWILAETEHCNKCGFCLPACPTYRITGQELHSPRGRIAMVEAAARGELPNLSGVEDALSYCVGCRACEVACPSGVRYERILEAGRSFLIGRGSTAFRGSLVGRTALYLSQHRQAFGQLARLGRRWRRLAPGLGIGSDLLAMLPQSPSRPAPLPQTAKSFAARPAKPRVAFFGGCVMESVFSDANHAAQALLAAAGFQVTPMAGQTCCGAIHLHSGEKLVAKEMARQNISALENGSWDWIVNTAGGCGAMLQEYPELFSDDPNWKARADRFAAKVRDFTTLLLDSSAVPLSYQGDGSRVALQNSCHLANVQRVAGNPSALIRQVQGDTFVTFQDQDMCCGSGGLYNINHRDWAQMILEDKMQKLRVEAPTRILVNNPGCHLQMQSGVSHHPEVQATVEHLATYLWRCYERSASAPARSHP